MREFVETGNLPPSARRHTPMKRILVLALGLTLVAAASIGTASAQHLSGNQAIDASWDWPSHCKKKPLPDNASDVAKSRIADRLCRPFPKPIPCSQLPCDPPPDPCRVLDPPVDFEGWWPCPIPPHPCLDGNVPGDIGADANRLTWALCPPPPCEFPLDSAGPSLQDTSLVWWPCPVPPPPCLAKGEIVISAPCPMPPPCPLPYDGAESLTWCPIPIPPQPCGTLDAAGTDYWRCPTEPKPVPLPSPLPDPPPARPIPVPLPAIPDLSTK